MQKHNDGVSEKRSSLRFKTQVRVCYCSFQSKLLTGYSVDLSPWGVFLTTDYPFDVDDIVTLKLFIPAQVEKPIICKARVAWVNNETNRHKPAYPLGVGLQFSDLTSEDLNLIVRFLDIGATF
jgi:uncharacterized protein (TIGR02266 family)